MSLGYLVCPTIQIQDINGKPIVGAKIYVYDANTSELTNTYKDFDGHLNTNPVLTDDLGNCTIIADDSKVYNIVVNDNNDNLLFSKDNLTCGSSVTYMSVDAGYGINITENDGTYTIAVDTDLIATQDDLAAKQDKLYAGDNIEIDEENQINVVNRREFQAQYPLRLDRSNDRLRLYIDSDFETNNLSAGPDIKITKYGNTSFIGVDTNSDANGEYNFYAGNSNTVSGDNNAVFGYGNEVYNSYNYLIAGRENKLFNADLVNYGGGVVAGYNCAVSGNNNNVIGNSNTVSGSNSYIFGYNNNVSSDNTYVFGHTTSAVISGMTFGINGNNNIEIRPNDDIYFKYNGDMVQLKPAVPSVPAVVYARPTLNLESRNYLNEAVYTTTEIPANTLFDGSITINNYIAHSILTYVSIGTIIENAQTYLDDMCSYPMTMNATGDGKMMTITIPIVYKNDSNVARKIGIRLNGSVMQQTLHVIIKGITFSV